LPAGLCFAGGVHDASQVTFLADRTWVDADGIRHTDQQIFDAVFDMIKSARRLVLLDMFLYNDFQRGEAETTRLLSGELTDTLLQQKQAYPDITIAVITDPINTVYGSLPSAQFVRLRNAGITVVITDLSRLRDSNPIYSLFWRLMVRPLGNSHRGFLPNPFDPRGKATLRSYLDLLNYKANHRKVLVTDDGDEMVGIVSTANAQDASSANINAAIRFTGPAAEDLLAAENAVLKLSGERPLRPPVAVPDQSPDVSVQVLTERAIKTEALQLIERTKSGERIDLATFYLSDRDVIGALKRAGNNGVIIRVLLDPNKNAFGHKKFGIPNRPVAAELRQANIDVRWGHTHGEHCHAKMMLVEGKNDGGFLLLGSANLTRRNLENFNLEANVLVRASRSSAALSDARNHFDLLWNNTEKQNFSVPYDRYQDESVVKKYLYRFMEASGWCTF
jgi:phosphatidylserine/phosphatidylglycerophosphate/cardiolipin synthase-like enzyme